MQMRDWGEQGFIRHLRQEFPIAHNLVGIGDDCAVIPKDSEESWLITTDALVENVHFIKEQMPAREVGYKTVAVNVSDIAAMGGTPTYAFFTIAAPKTLEYSWLSDLVQGLKEACDLWNIQLMGGDTVGSHHDLFLSLTLMGISRQSHLKYRHTAHPGDILCVTRSLGDSGGGLKALLHRLPFSERGQKLIQAHFHPLPSPSEGVWLASQEAVHAMIDLSDGLHRDVQRLLEASHTGGAIEISQIPLSEELQEASREHGWNPIELALTGGEDYCLLLTIAPESFEKIQKAFSKKFQKNLVEIGRITDRVGELSYLDHGQLVDLLLTPFEHF